MKTRLFLSILFASLSSAAFAQLYVSPASYVYVSDQYLFVRQDVNLQNNSNVYLRNGAQLLQATASTGTNSGLGNLSLFQEGTVDNFEYNYWCSPVGGPSASAGNSNFGITQLSSPLTITTSTPAIMLPTTNTNGIASPLSISQRWVFKYTMNSNYSAWVQVNSASNIAAGEGFTMKGTSGTDATVVNGVANNPGSAQRYDFRGKPNDGNISIPLATGQWTLTGNPYPSAIDLAAFLVAETTCTGSAYFWEQNKSVNSHLLLAYQGGYGTYSGGTNIYVPAVFTTYDITGLPLATVGTGSNYARRFSPIGQGFMLEGASNGSAVMRNNYRVFQKESPTLSAFERTSASADENEPAVDYGMLPEIPSVSGFDYTTVSAAPTPQIRFNVALNDGGIRQLVLAFREEATDGIDHALDSKSPGDALPADMYFAIENKEFVISVIDFDLNKKVPVGLKNAANASYRITVSEMINFNEASHVYVHDKVLDVYHEITDAEFQMDMPAGNNFERYEITFTTEALGVKDHTKQDLLITQNNQSFTLHNPGLADIEEVYLFDVSGKKILHKKSPGVHPTYDFSTIGLSEAVYIVKVVSKDKQDFAQKIIVSHKSSE